MKILITGAQGQVGHGLLSGLTGHDLIPRTHEDLDITQLKSVKDNLNQAKPDLVINAAGYTNVDGSEKNIEEAFRANEEGPKFLAQITAQMGIPILHLSSDYVFDGKTSKPYVESDIPHPLSVYGKSKLGGEEEVKKNNPKHYIVRTSWVYHNVGRNFPKTILSKKDQAELLVVDDQIGCPTYVPHLVLGIEKLIQKNGYGLFHMAGGGKTSWYGFARELFSVFKIKTPILPVKTSEMPRPAQRPAQAVLVSERNLGIALPPWEEGVKDFYQSFQK